MFRSETTLLNHFGGFLLQRDCPQEQGLVFVATFPNVGNFTVANQPLFPQVSPSLHRLTRHILPPGGENTRKQGTRQAGLRSPFPPRRAGRDAQPGQTYVDPCIFRHFSTFFDIFRHPARLPRFCVAALLTCSLPSRIFATWRHIFPFLPFGGRKKRAQIIRRFRGGLP